MIRRLCVTAMAALLLFTLFSVTAAGSEEPDPATPTDLDCAHEHTKKTIYFYDSPAYTPISAASHRVSGPAEVEIVCLDCGEVLSDETDPDAEEIRPHSMKSGVCALCGYRDHNHATLTVPEDLPGEKTLFAQEDEGTDGLLALALSDEDFIALQNANISTALIRGETGTAVIALDVRQTLVQMKTTESALSAEMAEREDGSLYASVYLMAASEEPRLPEEGSAAIRFYQDTEADVRVALAPADTDDLLEIESTWNEHGYWTVPYTEEGTYFLLH